MEEILSQTSAGNATNTTAKPTKWRTYKNLIALSLSFFFLFSVFVSLSTLQTSIHGNNGLGSTSMCIIYAFFVVSCLFLPELLISYLTIKWTIVLSMVIYTSFLAAGFVPAWYTLYPTSVLLGLAAGPLWISQSVYITSLGKILGQCVAPSSDKQSIEKRMNISILSVTESSKSIISTGNDSNSTTLETEGKGTRTDSVATITIFMFGIFYAFYQAGTILGQLISSLTLKSDIVITSRDNSSVNYFTNCGSAFCSGNDAGNSNFIPSQTKLNILYSVYFALSLSALLVVLIFMDNIPQKSIKDYSHNVDVKKIASIWSMCFSTLNQMRDLRQLFMIPLSVFFGLHQGIVSADLTKAYVTCYYGVEYVGYVMMVYGAVSAVFCPVSGYLSKRLPCWSLFLVAAITHSIIFVILAFAKQAFVSHFYLIFVVAGLLGFFFGIFQPQINGLYSTIFQENPEPAFANHRLWESVGMIISFSYHEVLCMKSKLIFLSIILALATVSYVILETRIKKRIMR
ncbi:unnamed protein product [Gordionus sp. m RMFG-2023]|uniref:protein unc-93 homolog A-like n=1 Tax=Gordionus sp. m RMFG-2023 TaxID=3053472 RepID=UPI0030E0939D